MTHPDTKPEALRLADALEHAEPNFYAESSLWFDSKLAGLADDAVDELRRLHPFEAECESLRTQLATAKALARRRLEQMTADRAQLAEARAEAEALRADAERWRKLSPAMASSEPVKVAAPMPTALEAFVRIQAENKARADALIAQGKCPDCEGDGQMGGQFCGGYWTCETCNGTGTAMGAKETK